MDVEFWRVASLFSFAVVMSVLVSGALVDWR